MTNIMAAAALAATNVFGLYNPAGVGVLVLPVTDARMGGAPAAEQAANAKTEADADAIDAEATNVAKDDEVESVSDAAEVTDVLDPADATNALAAATVEVTNVVSLTVVETNVVTATNFVMEVVKDPKVHQTTNIVTRAFKLYNANSDDLAERFNATWTGDFGAFWKISKVAQSFPEANTVMVSAPKEIVDACARIVETVDVSARQVYVEARFVELSNQAFHRLGIDWSMLNGMTGNINLGGGVNTYNVGAGVKDFTRVTGGSQYEHTTYSLVGGTTSQSSSETFTGDSDGSISHFTGTLDFNQMAITLKALEGSTDARTFSNPKIIVTSGKKATVDMTTKYPNVTVSAKRTLNGSDTSSIDIDMKMSEIPGSDTLMFAKEAFFSWGISLDVTPRVLSNNVINVEIVPTISSLNTDIESSGFVQASESDNDTPSSKYPVINVQRLLTEFDMSSGQTAVIGGLSRTVEEQMDTGIPWLRDLWWIGPRLFGGKERVKTQREIIVFVTVGLVDASNVEADAGLPLNAVLGRQYTEGIRHEPGERRREAVQGVESLDLRSLEEQAHDPRRTNAVRTVGSEWRRLKKKVTSIDDLPIPQN